MGNASVVGVDEAKLWSMADALRNNMDAAEYKHVLLGLIFLKYISNAFEAKHAELEGQRNQGADPEDPDEHRAASIFWVPKEAQWSHLRDNAPQPKIGTIVDEAMTAIERDNASLKGVLGDIVQLNGKYSFFVMHSVGAINLPFLKSTYKEASCEARSKKTGSKSDNQLSSSGCRDLGAILDD